MGIPKLIKTLTASDSASLAFVDGAASVTLDSTYDEYMFVCTDMGPATDGAEFQFQVNVSGGSGFDEGIISTTWIAQHGEDDNVELAYQAGDDQAGDPGGTAYQTLVKNIGNGADESTSGILHLFAPSNTTYATHFYARFNGHEQTNYSEDTFTAGYINVTGAIDEISFKFSSGNLDGVIQMYEIA